MRRATNIGMMLATLAGAGGGASAQALLEPHILDLAQIRLTLANSTSPTERDARFAAFKAATSRIASCAELESLAREAGGELKRARVPPRTLPPELMRLVLATEIGKPTPTFGTDFEIRVLIRCG